MSKIKFAKDYIFLFNITTDYYEDKDLNVHIVFDFAKIATLEKKIKSDDNYLALINYLADSISSLDWSYINSLIYERNKIENRDIQIDFKDILIGFENEIMTSNLDNIYFKEMELLHKIFSAPEFQDLPIYKKHIDKILSCYDINLNDNSND